MFQLFDNINVDFENGADYRTKDWFLIPPVSVFSSLSFYILLIKFIIPKYMENRKPYKLKNVLLVYNAAEVAISAYLFYLAYDCWSRMTFWKCNSIDKANNPDALKPAVALHLFFLSKYVEFLDTVFFALRKKYNQISFLHVYHHISTPMFVWFVMRYYPGGSYIFLMLFNSGIHVIMYSYYLLAALGPKMQKYLWWKKYITVFQLVQFVVCLVHFVIVMCSSDCNISPTAAGSIVLNSIVLYFLFSHFYNKSYQNRSKTIDSAAINSKKSIIIEELANSSKTL